MSILFTSSHRRQLILFAFFGLTSFLALYAVLFSTGKRIPGEGVTDYYHFAWSYWWIKHALSHPGIELYQTDYVFFPYTNNLALHTMAPFWWGLWAVAEPFLGRLGAFNVISWAAFTLTGWLTYAFLRREGSRAGLALLGGVTLQMTPLMFMAVWWTTPNLLGVFWYPAHLLVWSEIVRRLEHRGWRVIWAVVLGVMLWAAAITDLQYILFLVFLLLPYGLLTLAEVQPRQRIQLVLLGLLAILVFLLLMWFAGPLSYLLAYDRSKLTSASEGLLYSTPFPEGYLSVRNYDRAPRVGGFIIWITALTVIAALVYRAKRRAWFWLAVCLVPLILTPGSHITILGNSVAMPYRYLHEGMDGIFRAPGRFAPVFVLPALVFVATTWSSILSKRGLLLVVPVVLLIIFAHHHVLESIETQPTPADPAAYLMMAEEDEEYVVLEVPIAAGDGIVTVGQPAQLQPMYYGSIHGKHMVTGHTSRVYLENIWYLRTDHPVLSWLGQRRDLEPKRVEDELRDMIYAYPIGYIVVHQDSIGLETTANHEVIGYLNRLNDLLCPIAVEGAMVVYRTTWHPKGCPPRIPPETEPDTYAIDLGGTADELYLGWGWYWREYPGGINWRWLGSYREGQLFLDLPAGNYTMSLAAQSFWRERHLEIWVNDVLVGEADVMPDTLNTLSFDIPAAVIETGKQLTLSLHFDSADTPAALGLNSDPRPLAIAVDWVEFARHKD